MRREDTSKSLKHSLEKCSPKIYRVVIIYRSLLINISSRFPGNSEADASVMIGNLEKSFLGTTYTFMLSEGVNLQPHTGVWRAVKGLK